MLTGLCFVLGVVVGALTRALMDRAWRKATDVDVEIMEEHKPGQYRRRRGWPC